MKRTAIVTTLALGLHPALLAGAATAAPGDLDPTFGEGGKVTTDFYSGDERGNALAFAGDGFVVGGRSDGMLALVRYTSGGEVDTGFGTGGIVRTILNDTPGSHSGEARDVTVQSDGKILVVGWMSYCVHGPEGFCTAGGYENVILRYLPDGQLDEDFGSAGKVTVSFEAAAVAIQSDGKIVVAGSAYPRRLTVARYLTDGQLDPSFGGGGVVTASVFEAASSVLVQPDGLILAAGVSESDGDDDFAITRLTPTGTPDLSFGTAGMVMTDFGHTEHLSDIALQTVDEEMRIVAVGTHSRKTEGICGNHCESGDFAIARYHANGELDTSFGRMYMFSGWRSGMRVTDLGSTDVASSVGTSTDGRILVAGTTGASGTYEACTRTPNGCLGDFALAKYTSEGDLDPTFGAGGVVKTSFGGAEAANDMVIQPADGRVLLAGVTGPSGSGWRGDFALARYDAAGTPPTVPEAPALTEASGEGAVHLEWTTPADGGSAITGYRIYRGTASGQKTLLTSVGRVNSFDDSGLVNGTRYFYRVSAVNTVGEGASSNEVSATPATVPSAPSLSATAGNATVLLDWTTPGNGGSPITGYRIYRGTSSGAETLLTSVGTVNSFNDTSASNGTRYFYRVSAVNAVGEGASSNEVSATPAAVPGAPSLTAAPGKPKGVTLTWTTPPNGGSPITGYRIYRGTAPGGETFLTAVGTGTSYKDTSATRGTTYFYIVRAVNAVGEGQASNGANARAN